MNAFLDEPAAWADPALLTSLVVPGLREETMRRLLVGRTAGRAASALRRALGPGDAATLDQADASLAVAPGATLAEIAAAAGSVWHARRVRALVMGSDIASFVARFGEAARQAALRHLPPPEAMACVASDDLAADIDRDALVSRDAWLRTLPSWARDRLRLAGLEADSEAPADSPVRAAWMRRLAGELIA